jgi:hypothetical protein
MANPPVPVLSPPPATSAPAEPAEPAEPAASGSSTPASDAGSCGSDCCNFCGEVDASAPGPCSKCQGWMDDYNEQLAPAGAFPPRDSAAAKDTSAGDAARPASDSDSSDSDFDYDWTIRQYEYPITVHGHTVDPSGTIALRLGDDDRVIVREWGAEHCDYACENLRRWKPAELEKLIAAHRDSALGAPEAPPHKIATKYMPETQADFPDFHWLLLRTCVAIAEYAIEKKLVEEMAERAAQDKAHKEHIREMARERHEQFVGTLARAIPLGPAAADLDDDDDVSDIEIGSDAPGAAPGAPPGAGPPAEGARLTVEVQNKEDGTVVCEACCFRSPGELITYDNRAYVVVECYATTVSPGGQVSRGVNKVVPWTLEDTTPVEAALCWAAHAASSTATATATATAPPAAADPDSDDEAIPLPPRRRAATDDAAAAPDSDDEAIPLPPRRRAATDDAAGSPAKRARTGGPAPPPAPPARPVTFKITAVSNPFHGPKFEPYRSLLKWYTFRAAPAGVDAADVKLPTTLVENPLTRPPLTFSRADEDRARQAFDEATVPITDGGGAPVQLLFQLSESNDCGNHRSLSFGTATLRRGLKEDGPVGKLPPPGGRATITFANGHVLRVTRIRD